MSKTTQFQIALVLCISTFTYAGSWAQFTLSGQVRTRTEFRAGQGTLPDTGAVPAAFTSQRTRLNFNYSMYRVKFGAVMQDVRVWGQDQSTNNKTTDPSLNGIMLHEAWAEMQLADTGKALNNLSLKIGRQELSYDDERLLGSLAWLQQSRRHDAAILKYGKNGLNLHFGVAFNQNTERKSSTIFNGTPTAFPAGTNGIGVLYKSFQYLYASKKLGKATTVSFLVFKDDFNKTRGNTLLRGVWSRYTTGVYFNTKLKEKHVVYGNFYYQSGSDRSGRNLRAWSASVYSLFSLGKLQVGPAIDVLSGTDGTDATNTTNNTFDPLYGTPHKYWGYMDYFYVADGFGTGGLMNPALKLKYKAHEKLSLSLDIHQFLSAAKIADYTTTETDDAFDGNLGQEIDFQAVYNMTKVVQMELGASYFAGTETLERIKTTPANFGVKDRGAYWMYLMITIKPDFIK